MSQSFFHASTNTVLKISLPSIYAKLAVMFMRSKRDKAKLYNLLHIVIKLVIQLIIAIKSIRESHKTAIYWLCKDIKAYLTNPI